MVPQGALKLGWLFKIVVSWGKKVQRISARSQLLVEVHVTSGKTIAKGG